ncbi:putative TetR-family transcriptional regulator [Actinoplanes missouriensis 431]|uniref:Putative TetR-family transcriptional regulator n=1 Tax=Actinoplanes missouriensis (strain ATCC 14538 / DSM 43046 / CBS 188.64 / JCM 3121 / NBRC 102363 / NCIMB 12654 / NRRL B-3342 / UNCC 431) TaxID=512565 RepID=I0H5T9_ACTM4|nr:TetR/AcrR family transcriptional regulator [Actinoplanes missouriensis]BAL88376.1 putative TetR-family transcriptional regulator [Actinoplanes missouriensis 431]
MISGPRTSGPRTSDPRGRRAEYAQLTRQAILEAARDLFVSQGYFETRVEEIAAVARVAPATVYAVGGGKNGLLRTLIADGTAGQDVAQVIARIEAITDPAELLRFIAHATRATFEQWSALMRQVVAAAPREPGVRETLDIAHDSMRGGFRLAADRLAALGGLRDGVDAARAADILWLHLCNAAYFIRTDDLGWSLDESETWATEALTTALLTERGTR